MSDNTEELCEELSEELEELEKGIKYREGKLTWGLFDPDQMKKLLELRSEKKNLERFVKIAKISSQEIDNVSEKDLEVRTLFYIK